MKNLLGVLTGEGESGYNPYFDSNNSYSYMNQPGFFQLQGNLTAQPNLGASGNTSDFSPVLMFGASVDYAWKAQAAAMQANVALYQSEAATYVAGNSSFVISGSSVNAAVAGAGDTGLVASQTAANATAVSGSVLGELALPVGEVAVGTTAAAATLTAGAGAVIGYGISQIPIPFSGGQNVAGAMGSGLYYLCPSCFK
ncbi:MAG TPA: hypothetical protein VK815_15800 [Candidatus Acidoferrales bacterium]|nr:hypothetical protein [Candidatus Acidoferrales bacterium]